MMFDPNPLFYKMVRIFKENYSSDNKVIICNEGSSRSSKTFDTFHFIVLFCDHNRNKSNDIYILRETLQNCRDYTFKDFKKCLSIIGVNAEYKSEGQKPYCNLYGNNIYFRGLDEEKNMEGYPSDILFINESLEIKNKERIAGLRMRCRKLIIMDWNPKFTQHWCFDLEGQPNTFFTHSTYKQNKHLEKSVIKEIESYCPWNFEDLHLPEKKRRAHEFNCKNGTAEKYRWQVYGEGIRSAPEGLIFQNVVYIDEWPIDVAPVHSMDFGFTTDPTALVKVGETKTDIYLELLLYQPTETSSEINDYAKAEKISKHIPCTADSSDKYTGENKGTVEMVKELKKEGWNIKKVKKTKSIMFWIGKMKKKRINIVRNRFYTYAKKEQENYRLKLVNGIAINQPVDDFNHFWDASRYGFMSLNENKQGMW